jgi:hypothetical protein
MFKYVFCGKENQTRVIEMRVGRKKERARRVSHGHFGPPETGPRSVPIHQAST